MKCHPSRYNRVKVVWAKSETRELLVRVLLDSGSHRSCIRANVAIILQCCWKERAFSHHVWKLQIAEATLAERVSVRLCSHINDAAVESEVLTIPEIYATASAHYLAGAC